MSAQGYRWAYLYVMKHPDAVLHHGLVADPFLDDPFFEHAWVTHDGVVKDWQTIVAGFGGRFRGRGYPEAMFKEMWRPQHVRSWAHAQAKRAKGVFGHYGPWTQARMERQRDAP